MLKRPAVSFIPSSDGRGCAVVSRKLPERPVERATIRLPLPLLADLKREAKKRRVDRDALAVAVLRTVLQDNLLGAVLDR